MFAMWMWKPRFVISTKQVECLERYDIHRSCFCKKKKNAIKLSMGEATVKDLGTKFVKIWDIRIALQEAQHGSHRWCILGVIYATKIAGDTGQHIWEFFFFLEYNHLCLSPSQADPCKDHTGRCGSWALKPHWLIPELSFSPCGSSAYAPAHLEDS